MRGLARIVAVCVALVAVAGSSAAPKPKLPARKLPRVAVHIAGAGWVTWKNGECQGHPGSRASVGDFCGPSGKTGTKVVVRASNPDQGWHFIGWGGICSGTRPSCLISIKRKRTSLVAVFKPTIHGTSGGG
jgi:hypothetical protein